jgi:TatA/E family protein of Tat protein translocase
MFGNLGFTELLFIFVIALIFFGPRKLPELGKSLGQTLAGFKRASEDFKRSWEEEVEVEKKRTPPPPPMASEDADAPVIAAAQGTVPAASIKTETVDAGTESENESSKAEQTV